MAMTVTPLTPAVGAEVSGVDLAALSDAEFLQIERAWHRYSALLFRGQQPHRRRSLELQPPAGRAGSAAQPGARPHESAGLPRHLCRLECGGRKGAADRCARCGRGGVAHRHELPGAASRRLHALRARGPAGRGRHVGLRHAGRLGFAPRGVESQGARPPHQARRHLQQRRLPAQRRRADRRSAQGARCLASCRLQASGDGRARPLSRPAAQFLRRRPFADGIRGAARCALGAYREARAEICSQVARRRSPGVGQPLDHAQARSLRRAVTPRHAPDADQR